MINPGELNKKIKIQKQTGTRPEDPWEDVATVWAAIVTTGGREFYAAQKINSETTALFKIRYKIGIDTTMRIVYGSREFSMLHINNVNEKNVELQISCVEVV